MLIEHGYQKKILEKVFLQDSVGTFFDDFLRGINPAESVKGDCSFLE